MEAKKLERRLNEIKRTISKNIDLAHENVCMFVDCVDCHFFRNKACIMDKLENEIEEIEELIGEILLDEENF